MKWIIVGCCLLSKDDGNGYDIGCSKIFVMARGDCSSFEVGRTLRGTVTERCWSEWTTKSSRERYAKCFI